MMDSKKKRDFKIVYDELATALNNSEVDSGHVVVSALCSLLAEVVVQGPMKNEDVLHLLSISLNFKRDLERKKQ